MTKLRHERDGPPRPGSQSLDHPRAIERPYVHVTEGEKIAKRKAQADAAKARGKAIRAAEWEARFGTPYPLKDL